MAGCGLKDFYNSGQKHDLLEELHKLLESLVFQALSPAQGKKCGVV